MKKAILSMLVIGLFGLSCSSCKKSDNDDDNNDSIQPTVNFTVTGSVSDDVQYSNTTTHTLQGSQNNGFMTFSGMGSNYSFSITVTADEVSSGTYGATQGQYINNSSSPAATFGELTSGQVVISSVSEVNSGAGKAYRVAGNFNMAIADAGGNGAVQIQGTFSNVTVLQ